MVVEFEPERSTIAKPTRSTVCVNGEPHVQAGTRCKNELVNAIGVRQVGARHEASF